MEPRKKYKDEFIKPIYSQYGNHPRWDYVEWLEKQYEALQTQLENFRKFCTRLSHLNQCEMEVMSSGMPEPEDWLKAFDELDELLTDKEV